MKKILAVSVHPDDETLGCGGTLLKRKQDGDQIFWCNLTKISVDLGWSPERVLVREEEIKEVARKYGFDGTFMLDFDSTKLDSMGTDVLVSEFSNVMKQIEPQILFIPFFNDVHTDHQTAFKAIYSATKSFRYPSIEKILMYETLSETDYSIPIPGISFSPNVFIDITEFFERKVEIMNLYKSEIMNGPFPRSIDTIKAAAQYRGSRIGADYAESFMQLFEKL